RATRAMSEISQPGCPSTGATMTASTRHPIWPTRSSTPATLLVRGDGRVASGGGNGIRRKLGGRIATARTSPGSVEATCSSSGLRLVLSARNLRQLELRAVHTLQLIERAELKLHCGELLR